MKKTHFPGLIPQKNSTFAVTAECLNGIMDTSLLKALGEIAASPEVTVHITTAQKIMILGLDEAKGKEVIKKLDDAGAVVRKNRDIGTPRVCVGKPWCKFAAQDTFAMAEHIYDALAREPISPKLKVAISGCPACCSWANMMDLGFVGVTSGFKVMLGGHGGSNPVKGTGICTINSPEEAVEILRRLAALFNANVKIKMRVDRLVKKLGFDHVKNEILQNISS